MVNVENNNNYNSKIPYYNDTLTYEEPNNVDNFDKYKSITNISQLRNYYIKQPNANEFIIKCECGFWFLMIPLFILIFSISIYIYALIFDKESINDMKGIIILILVLGFLILINLIVILLYPIRKKVILFEEYFKIITYHLLCCYKKNKIYSYMNIKYFQVKTLIIPFNKEINIIFYFDINNRKKQFFPHNFKKEEAEYFVYIINGYINKKKNIKEIF